MIAELTPAVAASAAEHVLQVAVMRAPSGGWQVIATCDGHLVASRHCDDWHRVERVRDQLARRSWAVQEEMGR
jgi:hypothetical protein